MAVPRVEEQYNTVKSVLSDLYAETSSLAFIFRLPTETLEDIFAQQARDYHSENGSHPTPTLPSWVNVSYVCRHWRNVALNCATLWTYVFIMSPRWTEELLTRSKQAPLKLHVKPNFQDQRSLAPCFVGQVMNHAERIQELRLSLPLVIWENQLSSNLSSPAPHLRNLEIWAPNLSASSEWDLPSVLFDGDTPALRTLQLSYCPVAWYSFKLSGLTALDLFNVPARFRQNTGDLLVTLRCMQDLTQLHLHDALASATSFLSSTTFRTFQKINLPHLSRFSIRAPLSTVVAMLSCVNIPLKTEIRLECDSEYGSSLGDFGTLASLHARRYNISGNQPPSIPIIRSLIFNIWTGSGAVLTFSGLERDDFAFSMPVSRWGLSIPLQTNIHFAESMTTSNMDRIITDICCSIPLANVETVRVVEPPFSSTFWRKILGHLPNLRCLKLSEGWMPDLASVLSLAPHGDTEDGGKYADPGLDRVLVPLLEELELYDIGFSPSLPNGLMMDPPAADVQSLFDSLSSRKESQGQLSIEYCQAYKSDRINALVDMVGRWENGVFHAVEDSSRPYHHPNLDSDSGPERSGSDSESLEDS